jgi:hypothetical protein
VVLNPDCYGNDLKPPENTPQMKNPYKDDKGKEHPNPGEVVFIGSNDYLVNIGGYEFRFTMDGDGNVTVKATEENARLGKNMDTAKAMAAGMQDGFNALPAGLRKEIMLSIRTFAHEMNSFYTQNMGTYAGMYGNNFRKFMFCATIGFAVAWELCKDQELVTLLRKVIYGSGLTGKVGAFGILMNIGFWTAHYNSVFNTTYKDGKKQESYKLTVPVKGAKGSEFTDMAGLTDMVKAQAFIWCAYRVGNINDPDVIKDIVDTLMVFGPIVVGSTTTPPLAAAIAAIATAWGVANWLISVLTNKGNHIIEGLSGATARMRNETERKYPRNPMNGQFGRINYTYSLFVGFSWTCGYFSAKLSEVWSAQTNYDNNSYRLKKGDIIATMDIIFTHYLEGNGDTLLTNSCFAVNYMSWFLGRTVKLEEWDKYDNRYGDGKNKPRPRP